jgi:hypothetical protein
MHTLFPRERDSPLLQVTMGQQSAPLLSFSFHSASSIPATSLTFPAIMYNYFPMLFHKEFRSPSPVSPLTRQSRRQKVPSSIHCYFHSSRYHQPKQGNSPQSYQNLTPRSASCFKDSRKRQKQSTAGIRWWSPTQLLTGRHMA